MQMKLIVKWCVFFGVLCFIVLVLAGLWYSRLFQWVFEEKLQQELVALVYVNKARFVSAFVSSSKVITIDEIDMMKNFLNDQRVVHALIVDNRGLIRWAPDAALFGRRLQEIETSHPLPTDALIRAVKTKQPKVYPFAREGKDYYEVAVPFENQGKILTVVSIEVSREEAQATAAQGMRKFYLGSTLAGGFLMFTGIIFLYVFIVNPLGKLRENIDNLSLTTLAWPSQASVHDEMGAIHHALFVFFEKLRSTISRVEKDHKDMIELEKRRWEHLLRVLVRSGTVLVLDADNYVLAGYNMDSLVTQASSKAGMARSGPPSGLPVGAQGSSSAAPAALSAAATKTHLLDLITSTDLLQLINRALERPGQFFDDKMTLQDITHTARVMTLAGDQPHDQRTIVWLESQTKPKGV